MCDAWKTARFMVYAILTFAEAQNDPTSLSPNGVVHLTHVESGSFLRVVADRQLPSDAVWTGQTDRQTDRCHANMFIWTVTLASGLQRTQMQTTAGAVKKGLMGGKGTTKTSLTWRKQRARQRNRQQTHRRRNSLGKGDNPRSEKIVQAGVGRWNKTTIWQPLLLVRVYWSQSSSMMMVERLCRWWKTKPPDTDLALKVFR